MITKNNAAVGPIILTTIQVTCDHCLQSAQSASGLSDDAADAQFYSFGWRKWPKGKDVCIVCCQKAASQKPPNPMTNIEWSKKSAGWDCRQVYWIDRTRRRRHLGHLGREAWLKFQSQFEGDELKAALAQWVNDRLPVTESV